MALNECVSYVCSHGYVVGIVEKGSQKFIDLSRHGASRRAAGTAKGLLPVLLEKCCMNLSHDDTELADSTQKSARAIMTLDDVQIGR